MLYRYIVKFWQQKNIINYLLLPISFVFFILSYLRVLVYKTKGTYISSKFIICIGNATVGGGGKTPTCISLSNKLINQGFKVVILTKGYKGAIQKPTLFAINEANNAEQTGDEAILLNKRAPVVISKNWILGLKFIEKLDFDIIITDDGYQNTSFFKNFNLLLVDAEYGFGNGFILPAGPLRESCKFAISKANAVLLIKYGLTINNDIYKRLNKDTFFDTKIEYSYNEGLKNKQILAFCGLANPNKFYQSLVNNNFTVANFIAYKDHHKYSNEDILNLIKKADDENYTLITTQKDLVKIPKIYHNKIYTLDIVINISIELVDNIVKNYKIFLDKK
jgi:tetraacyldisaccharide 4'-kinase